MDIYTMDRGFIKQEEIDVFESAMWIERYYGDGDFDISLPANLTNLDKLPKGQLLGCKGSDQPMILETRDIKEGILKITGITLTQWLNNRIIRTSADHAVKDWAIHQKPGEALAYIVSNMCMTSSYLNGTIDIGIPVAQTELFVIPGLQIGETDDTGVALDFSVPFGPVYDVLKDIATTYEIGMKITLDGAFEDYYIIQFRTWKGVNRTSDQSINPVIRFSEEMDSLTEISDLESIADHRNFIYTFAPGAPPELVTGAGFDFNTVPLVPEPGFDLKVWQGFVDEITADTLGGSSALLLEILNQKATSELNNHKAVALVDGQIVEVEGVVYGTDFFLGDVVEVEGNTGILQKARITEYIRSQDSAGERAYPTLSMID